MRELRLEKINRLPSSCINQIGGVDIRTSVTTVEEQKKERTGKVMRAGGKAGQGKYLDPAVEGVRHQGHHGHVHRTGLPLVRPKGSRGRHHRWGGRRRPMESGKRASHRPANRAVLSQHNFANACTLHIWAKENIQQASLRSNLVLSP